MPTSLPLDRILPGDCVETLAALPAESVDLIFADPPYNLQLHQELWRPNQTKVNAVDNGWDQFADFAAYDDFTRAWLAGCRRVLKPSGTLWVIGTYHNIHRIGAILQDMGFWTLNSVVWVKTNPMPNFRGVRFTNAHETLLWVQKDKGAPYTFNHQAMKALNEDTQMRSDWVLPICTGPERIRLNGERAHPTQKPEALLYRVILSSSNPGDVVLDPFFGSGTTGAVAKKLNRSWIGIERDPDYIAVAQARLEAIHAPQGEPALYRSPNPRKQARLPFGRLVESGLLIPGQRLFLRKSGEISAMVRADGMLEYNRQRFSIHKLARELVNGPANGWEVWHYEQDGQRLPIDHLRQQLRDQMLEEPSGIED
ncbi:MAG: site-specific DNA-methyltransferase [Anaerolineae bacterium]|nr:MAG: site-specific DNA-methyltransferase [Anaerolineae bacterium]